MVQVRQEVGRAAGRWGIGPLPPDQGRFWAVAAGLSLSLLGAALPAKAIAQPGAASNPDLNTRITAVLQDVARYAQVSDVFAESELEVGQQINHLLLTQYPLHRGRAVNQYVDQVGQSLVAVGNPRDISFTFQVLASDRIDAFSVPGGFVYVTTGLLQAVDNEAELAAVLAHEIARVNQRHNGQALKQWMVTQVPDQIADADPQTLAQIGYQLAVDLPRNPEFEHEADRLGVALLRQAGYPQTALLEFLERRLESVDAHDFLQARSNYASRVEALQTQALPLVSRLYLGLDSNQYQQRILPLIDSDQPL
jgi:beta-barrel assembly-enhancing protease